MYDNNIGNNNGIEKLELLSKCLAKYKSLDRHDKLSWKYFTELLTRDPSAKEAFQEKMWQLIIYWTQKVTSHAYSIQIF